MKKLFFICTIFIVACSVEEDLYDNEKSQITVNQDKIKQTSRSNNSGKNVNTFYSVDLKVEGEGEIKMSVVETGMAISVLSGKNKSSGNSIKAIDNLKPNDSSFINGTKIKLEAIPKYDFIKFEEWSGDISGMENPVFVTIDNQKNIKGKFVNKHIYLADNGKTIKARETAQIGDKGIINGEVYTIVDETTLREMVKNEEDVTNVVTTFIDNMNDLFKGISTDGPPGTPAGNKFNQDISSWDVSNVTTMRWMFSSANAFNQDIGNWDVSNVTDMYAMFANDVIKIDSVFNQDIGDWDVSNVTDMTYMFFNTDVFNQDIGNWDVGNVTSMLGMFALARSFNQDISSWDVSNVTTMRYMFFNTDVFNQDIGNWDVGNVTSMYGMFYKAESFNGGVSDWDVSNVTDMNYMFYAATTFNQDISSWCFSKITEEPSNFSDNSQLTEANKPRWGQDCNSEPPIGAVFLDENGITVRAADFAKVGDIGEINGETYTVVNLEILKTMISEKKDITKVVTTKITYMASILDAYYFPDFNQDISSWDLSNVTDISGMFYNQKTFNQDISVWNVSNVTNMSYTFTSAHSFNQPLDSWDTSNVINMNSMFWYATSFNQDLNNWDVSKVTEMLSLFDKSGFNGTVSSWDVSNVKNMFAIFAYTPFNQDISNWNVSNVENMGSIFYSNMVFNQDISNWDISNVRDLSGAFGFSVFNQNISNWDTSNVSNMAYLFSYNDFFNQDISNWDVSKVENMFDMFVNADNFNQDIGNWDVSNVTEMNNMFLAASNFNQDISSWCVSKITEEPSNFSDYSQLENTYKPVWGTCPD